MPKRKDKPLPPVVVTIREERASPAQLAAWSQLWRRLAAGARQEVGK